MGRLSNRWLLCVMLGWGAPLTAEASSVLTLSEAVEAAWARSPEARAHPLQLQEAVARGERAEAWVAGPGAMSVSHTADRQRPDQGQAEWEVEWSWPLWLPGQRTAQRTLAEREGAALASRRQAIRIELAEEVGRRHSAWRLACEEAQLARHRAADAQRLETDLVRRLQVGQVARFEVNLARAEHLQAQTLADDATLAAQQARAEWILLTGLALESPPQLTLPTTPGDRVEEPAALRAARQAEAVAAARVTAQQAATREAPELALRVLRQRDGVDQTWGDQLGVKLTVPFGSGAAWRAGTASAEAEQARALATLEREAQRAEQTLLQAKAERARSDQALAAAIRRQQLAEDNHQLADQAYRLGQFDLATLLRARAAAFEAAVDVRRAEARQHLAQLQQLLNSGVSP